VEIIQKFKQNPIRTINNETLLVNVVPLVYIPSCIRLAVLQNCNMTCKTNFLIPVDKIMETLRIGETEFVVAILKELQLTTMNILLPFVYTL
jgi:hypothetical protein